MRLNDLPYANGEPACSGVLRTFPEDFIVEELSDIVPDGAGEHLLVQVRKRNANTAWVAGWLAKAAGLRERDIGYAGMKDRHAVTTQWFSVPLINAPEPDWPQHEDIEILSTAWHGRKLRRGALTGNHFTITLREVTGDIQDINARIEQIGTQGVPNYFGEQRFGRGGQNVERAQAMFAGRRVKRQQRGLYLSAARSYLFNRVLAARVQADTWRQLLPGEAVMLSGSRSFFTTTTLDEALEHRLAAGDVQPSGPLWGRGDNPATGDAGALETQTLADAPDLMQGLEQAGLKQERRALRLTVPDLAHDWLDKNTVQLRFSLPAGCYATSVLRDVLDYELHYEDKSHAKNN
ncbi:MAG TPA: tRNA pseudouridine(13) synthase TruD [Gammaproteobacteria bacterium]|nr:tRNA pseudouridine(13) synthase TruD [Gammaproteobacteria bacterium]